MFIFITESTCHASETDKLILQYNIYFKKLAPGLSFPILFFWFLFYSTRLYYFLPSDFELCSFFPNSFRCYICSWHKSIFLFLVILKKHARDLSIFLEVPKKTFSILFFILVIVFYFFINFDFFPTSFFLISLSRMCFSSIFFSYRLFLATTLSFPSLPVVYHYLFDCG